MVSALRGIADALRPEASRHYQRLHLNEAIEGSKKLAQDIQNQSDPDANAPWKQSLKDVREYGELPREARDYVSFIEEYTETAVDIVSVGYDRHDTIVRKSPWIRY